MGRANSAASARKPRNAPKAAPRDREAAETKGHDSAASKPQLRIAPEPPRRFRKLFVASITLSLLGLVAIPFAIVLLHATLLTGQRDLDHLRQDLNEQLELRQQLLFERSLAVSPQRIITIARDELGMVSAENIVYLQSATPAVSPTASAQPSAVAPQPAS